MFDGNLNVTASNFVTSNDVTNMGLKKLVLSLTLYVCIFFLLSGKFPLNVRIRTRDIFWLQKTITIWIIFKQNIFT